MKNKNLIVDNICVFGLAETAIASGFPMVLDTDDFNFFTQSVNYNDLEKGYKRLDKLAACKGGESHDCALCGVVVQFNLTAPRYFWQEWQRYHYQDIISSMSTMHRIKSIIKRAEELRSKIEDTGDENDLKYCDFINSKFAKECDIGYLEDFFLNASKAMEDLDDLQALRYIKANLPEGLKLTARITTNYRQLKTIYHQRKTHRLEEWRDFCETLKKLPHSNWITGEK